MWKHTDSNRGPSACKADALNQLSYASILLRAFLSKNYSLKGSAKIRSRLISPNPFQKKSVLM
jgi:hypothetical protein